MDKLSFKQFMQRGGNLALFMGKVLQKSRNSMEGMRCCRGQGINSPGTDLPSGRIFTESAFIQRFRMEQEGSTRVSQPGSAQQPSVLSRYSYVGRGRVLEQEKEEPRFSSAHRHCVVWITHFSFLSPLFRHLKIAKRQLNSAFLTYPDARKK